MKTAANDVIAPAPKSSPAHTVVATWLKRRACKYLYVEIRGKELEIDLVNAKSADEALRECLKYGAKETEVVVECFINLFFCADDSEASGYDYSQMARDLGVSNGFDIKQYGDAVIALRKNLSSLVTATATATPASEIARRFDDFISHQSRVDELSDGTPVIMFMTTFCVPSWQLLDAALLIKSHARAAVPTVARD